jgi:hypothetical protein
MNDDDRIAYLAGEPTGSIDDSDERADLDELRALLADPGLWDEPPPSLEDAVVAAVSSAVGERSGSTTVAPLPPVAATPPRRSSEPVAPVISIDRHRSRWIRPAAMLLSAAAAVVIVIAGATVLINDDNTAETFSMALEPTEALPAATGSATLTKTDSGWRIEFDATGLPRLADGLFYQAWLRNEEGTLVPIGSFNEGDDVVLWAGVSPLLFPTLTVTREAADNVQDSSGDRVLVGTLTPATDD